MFLQNVHHAGQLMPGDEQEDIVMTSSQCNLLNITCPLTGKPVTELADPVRRYCNCHFYTVLLHLPMYFFNRLSYPFMEKDGNC